MSVAAGSLVGLVGGCGGDQERTTPPGPCETNRPLELTIVPEVPGQGRVALTDEVDSTIDDEGTPRSIERSRTQASFAAQTNPEADSSPAELELSDQCIVVVSRPPPGPLVPSIDQDVGTLTISGPASGPWRLSPLADGSYNRTDSPVYETAADLIEVEGEGGSFGAFSATVPSVTPLLLTAPTLDGSGAILPGELTFEWVAGEADYVEIRVSPVFNDPRRSGGQVICVVADDGCFNLPSAATRSLRADNTATYIMSVQRTNVRLVMPDPDRVIKISAISRVRATLVYGGIE